MRAATLISQRSEVLPVRREEYWNLFWLSGMPEAWLMSRPARGDFDIIDMTANGVSHRGADLPKEVQQMEQNRAEMYSDLPGRARHP